MSDNGNPNATNWVQSPLGVADFYANTAHVTWTLDDVRVRLGQLIQSLETPNPGVGSKAVSEERAAITFSWRNAKLLRDQLSKVIANYEKVNGSINLSPELASNSDTDS